MLIRLSIIAILCLGTSATSWGMGQFSETVRDQRGRPISNLSVTVYNAGTLTLSTIYSDNGVTPKTNPFTAGIFTGDVNFYAANGKYDVVYSAPGATFDNNRNKNLALLDGYGPIRLLTAFPTSPSVGDLVVITDDSSSGACDSNDGSAISLCLWDGADWFSIGGTGGGGGVTGWPTVSTTKEITWADSFANAMLVGNGTNKWAIYNDATDGLQMVCVIAGVANDCNYIRKLASGKTFTVQNSSGTAIFTVTESTGALTNVTIDAEATGNTITLTQVRWVDAAGCQAAVAQLVWNSPSSNAPAAVCDPDSTPNAYASFDATTDESFDFDFVLPTGFTGAIDFHFIWKAAATSGAVGWCAQLVRVPDGTTSGQSHAAQSSSNCVSDTAKGTTLQENRADKTSVTCTSCAAGDRVKGRISRDADGGAVTDDMTGDAHLIKFGYTIRVAK